MRDSLRTFCLRQLYQNPACSSNDLVELAHQQGYLEPSTQDPQTRLLSVLAGIPREERLNNDRFFPGGLGEFRAYDSLVTVLAQSRTLDTTLLRPLVGAVNLALHQDRRFYCLEDGSWYLQHQTIVNDQLFSALNEESAAVSLKQWLENFITKNSGTVPVFWSLDPRFVLEGEHVRLNAHCTLLGQEIENLWPVWEAKFAHGTRVSTESLLQAFPQHDDCKPSIASLEQVLALKGVSPIGNDLWMQEAFIPKVPSVGGAVAFLVADVLKEEPLAFPSLLVLDSLGLGEVVLTAAHRIYGVLPISWNKAERLHYAKGMGLGLGLKPEDNTFEVWHQDGFLYSEALAERLSLLGPGQRLRLSVTEEGLSFELRGFDARVAQAQSGLFSREELLLPSSALRASLLAKVQAESEGINLSTLLANLDADYSLSEITLALTSPLIERGAGGFCRYKASSFDPQEAILALRPESFERQPQDLSPSQPILEEEEDSLTALSPEPQSPEAWSKFQEDVEPYITLTEAELLELIQEQASASENTAPPAMEQSLDEPLAAQAALDTPPIPEEKVVSEDEKTFSPSSLEELFSLQSEEEDPENILSVQDVQVLQEESEEDVTELINSLYSDSPSPQTTLSLQQANHQRVSRRLCAVDDAIETEASLVSLEHMHADSMNDRQSPLEDLVVETVSIESISTDVQPLAPDFAEVQALQIEKQEDQAPELMQKESAPPVELDESVAAELEVQELVLLEVQPVSTEMPSDLALDEVDEVPQMTAESMEHCLEEPAEQRVSLAEEKEDAAQAIIPAVVVAEAAEEAGLPLSEPVVSSLLLEDLMFDLLGEKPEAPIESIEEELEEQEPILLEIHPASLDTPAIEVAEEAILFAAETMELEQSLGRETIIQDLTGTEVLSLSNESVEPEAEITPPDSEPKERLGGSLEDLVFDLLGEKPTVLETIPIAVEDTGELFEELEELHVEELHEPIQEALEPTSSLWIDELRMDLAKEKAPLQKPTEISSAATTASPEAIAFLHTLFEEEREAEKDEAEKDEAEKDEEEQETSRPSASLQAKLDQLVAQREAILAQRQPAWTKLMQIVMAQTALSPRQQEEFQEAWMGKQTVLSPSLCALLEPSVCQLTVLSRLPLAGPLELFAQTLKEQTRLEKVDPTGVLESLILPALQYRQTAEGWAQKSV